MQSFDKPGIFASPDENVEYHAILNVIASGNPHFDSSGALAKDGPRHTTRINGELYPSAPIFFHYLAAILAVVFGITMVPVLFSVFFILSVYLLAKRICPEKAEVIVLLLSFFPAVSYWFGSFYNNIAAAAFGILSIAFFLQGLSDDKKGVVYLIIGSFIASISALLRHEYLIIAGSASVVFFFRYLLRRQIFGVFVSFLILCLPISSIFLVNNVVYESSFDTFLSGSQSVNAYQAIMEAALPLTTKSHYNLMNNITNYLISLFDIFFLFVCAGLVLLMTRLSPPQRIFMGFILILFVLFTFVRAGYYGFGGFTIRASYVRYAVPVYTILVFGLVGFLKTYSLRFKGVLVSSFIVIMMLTLIPAMSDLSYQKGSYSELQKKFNSIIPEGSLVVTNYWDKLLFPQYPTVSLSHWLTKVENEKFESFIRRNGCKEFFISSRNIKDWLVVRGVLIEHGAVLESVYAKQELYRVTFEDGVCAEG